MKIQTPPTLTFNNVIVTNVSGTFIATISNKFIWSNAKTIDSLNR